MKIFDPIREVKKSNYRLRNKKLGLLKLRRQIK